MLFHTIYQSQEKSKHIANIFVLLIPYGSDVDMDIDPL